MTLGVHYALPIERRSVPDLDGRAVIAGLAIAVVAGVAARTALAPIPGLVATVLGIGLGGFVAGKWAKSAGLYHGAMVGVGVVVLDALGAMPGATYSADVLADTATVIALDLVTLVVASLGGWIAGRGPSSSSGTGTAR